MLAGIMPDFGSFGPDEMFLLIGSGVVCFIGFVHWARRLQSVSKLGCHPLYRVPLYFAVLIGFGVLAWVVGKWADPQIRENSGYVLLVFLMGGACLTLACALLPWLGLGLRDDAFERRNFAAVLVLSGATLGMLITYSAATTGEGPSFWNNVFSSLLATGTLLLLWVIVAVAGSAARSITEERDVPSGLRLGSWLVAEALILGRAVAGDWESAETTARDFVRDGWSAFALCAGAAFVERALRPTAGNPRPSPALHGWVPAIVYLFASLGWCARLGWWEGATQ
jgi:hypothetical protein